MKKGKGEEGKRGRGEKEKRRGGEEERRGGGEEKRPCDGLVETSGEPSRRGFLGRFWLLLGGVAFVEAVWIAADFFGPRRRRSDVADDGAVIVAGPVDRFEPGSVTAFQGGRFYLTRLGDGGFLALHRECTHLGCTVPWVEDQERFVCPCHASAFDIKGEVLSPPAPRPLDLFPVRIENGIVKVDVSRTIKRQAFSETQVVRS